MKYEFKETSVANLAAKAKALVEKKVAKAGPELNSDVAVKFFKANELTQEQSEAAVKVLLVTAAEKYDLSTVLSLVAEAADANWDEHVAGYFVTAVNDCVGGQQFKTESKLVENEKAKEWEQKYFTVTHVSVKKAFLNEFLWKPVQTSQAVFKAGELAPWTDWFKGGNKQAQKCLVNGVNKASAAALDGVLETSFTDCKDVQDSVNSQQELPYYLVEDVWQTTAALLQEEQQQTEFFQAALKLAKAEQAEVWAAAKPEREAAFAAKKAAKAKKAAVKAAKQATVA